MISLVHRVFPDWIAHRAAEMRDSFGPLAAFALTYGNDHWKTTLKLTSHEGDAALLFWEGERTVLRQPGSRRERDIRFDTIKGLARVTLHELMTDDGAPACAIAMPGSCILLSTLEPSLYVTMPDASAHETLQDQILIERTFPGLFEIA